MWLAQIDTPDVFFGAVCYGPAASATPWRLLPLRANGQLAFACYQQGEPGGDFVLGAVNVLGLRGDRIAEVTGFLDPAMTASFGLTKRLPEDR